MLSDLLDLDATPTAPVRHPDPTRPTRPSRRERRRQARHHLISARITELELTKAVLTQAAGRVSDGWCQGSWSTVLDGSGAVGVCLVTAIRASGRCVADPQDQIAERAVDVAWHTLQRDPDGLRWVPPPSLRSMRVRELARWNDARGRGVDEVAALLTRSVGYADDEVWRLRREHWL